MPPILIDLRMRNRIRLEAAPEPWIPKYIVRHLMDDGDPDRIEFGGTAIVCCRHGRQKRAVRELTADTRREYVHLCPCCESLYEHPTDEPGPCPGCHPTSPRRAA